MALIPVIWVLVLACGVGAEWYDGIDGIKLIRYNRSMDRFCTMAHFCSMAIFCFMSRFYVLCDFPPALISVLLAFLCV